jgi:Fic family protein
MAEARTVRVGPGKVIQIPEEPIRLNPDGLHPRKQKRWTIGPHIAGMMERLARARYEIAELMPSQSQQWLELTEQQRRLTQEDAPVVEGLQSEEEVISAIAQSVYASSAIEGEAVHVKDVNLAIVGRIDNREGYKEDYAERVRTARSIYSAYVWTLAHSFPLEGAKAITVDFIREVHRRMFVATRPDIAGKWKERPNRIQWGNRLVLEMVPPSRVEELLSALCDRINDQFNQADTNGRYSKLMATAEFVLDFLAIHPFADGNGRTARLLSTYLLERSAYHFARFYALDTVILDRQQDYYLALFQSQMNWYSESEDLTPWTDFYIQAIFAQWLRAHEEILKTVNGSRGSAAK